MIKKFLALFLLASTYIQAASFATGTTALYLSNAGELTDATGNFSALVENGAVPFVTSPAPCISTNFYGTYSNANFYTLPADVLAALAGYTSWSLDFCINLNSMPGSPIPFGDGGSNFFQFNGTGGIRWGTSGGIVGFGTNVTSNGVSYEMTVSFDGTNKRVYFNGSPTPYLGPTAQGASSSFAVIRIGKYAGAGEAVDGYISNFRVMNIAAVPPIIDPVAAASSYQAIQPGQYQKVFNGQVQKVYQNQYQGTK